MRARTPPLISACSAAAAIVAMCLIACPRASASNTQEAIIEDNNALQADPSAAMEQFKELGVTLVKVAVYWNTIAPKPNATGKPKGFNAANPGSYPGRAWNMIDSIVRVAKADGISVGFMLMGPPPRWAQNPGRPKGCACLNWKPNDEQFQRFAKAVGTRYSGHYKPKGQNSALPRVSWWSIWNEPNFGPSLSPQATGSGKNMVWVSPHVYRGLLEAGWSGLNESGHRVGKDTILFGETSPRGTAGSNNTRNWAAYNPKMLQQMLPLIFVHALYCVGADGKRFTGEQAKREHCAESAERFRKENPALFHASGYADHPYAQGTTPGTPTYACGARLGGIFCSDSKTKRRNPYYADLAAIPTLERTLDRLQRVYGSGKEFPIWSTEFGYWTKPPDNKTPVGRRESVSAATAAYYMNWAEYLSYKNPRVASYDQYQLVDPADGTWGDGLLTSTGKPKPGYRAFMTPLYLPKTEGVAGGRLLVWGGVRPAAQARQFVGPAPRVEVQFKARNASRYTTLRTAAIRNERGYFTLRVAFPRSGTVRLAWTDADGLSEHSRTQAITIVRVLRMSG